MRRCRVLIDMREGGASEERVCAVAMLLRQPQPQKLSPDSASAADSERELRDNAKFRGSVLGGAAFCRPHLSPAHLEESFKWTRLRRNLVSTKTESLAAPKGCSAAKSMS